MLALLFAQNSLNGEAQPDPPTPPALVVVDGGGGPSRRRPAIQGKVEADPPRRVPHAVSWVSVELAERGRWVGTATVAAFDSSPLLVKLVEGSALAFAPTLHAGALISWATVSPPPPAAVPLVPLRKVMTSVAVARMVDGSARSFPVVVIAEAIEAIEDPTPPAAPIAAEARKQSHLTPRAKLASMTTRARRLPLG